MLRADKKSNESTRHHQMIDDTSLSGLSPETLAEIISHMSIPNIIRLAMTSKQLSDSLLDDNSVMLRYYWQKKLQDYFPDIAKDVKENFPAIFFMHYVRTIKTITPEQLKNSNQSIQKDFVIALAALRKSGCPIFSVHASLRHDREFMLAAVRQDGLALYGASDNLRRDREIVLAAVRQSGWALRAVSDNLRRDREIVLAALRQSEWALRYADKSLQDDRELVRIANIGDAAARAKACDLDQITWKLQQPNVSRTDILDLFEKVKDPEGEYKAIHKQNNARWDAFRLGLFNISGNERDAKQFWHTATYQKAVKLLKEAYVLRKDDQTDKDRSGEANNLIDYTRRNLFGSANETESRKQMKLG